MVWHSPAAGAPRATSGVMIKSKAAAASAATKPPMAAEREAAWWRVFK